MTEPTPTSTLTDEELGDLGRLLIARSDLTSALTTARYVLGHVKDIRDELWVPLQDATLIAYARPFTSNRPFGPLPDAYSQFESVRLRDLHKNILELRHKTIAHSDADIRRVIVDPPGVQLGPKEAGKKGGVAVATNKLPPSMFTEVEELCLHVGRQVNHAADELTARLFATEQPDHAYNLLTKAPIDD